MKTIVILFMLISCFLFSSCDKKQAAIDSLEDFSEELKENSYDYSVEEWEDAIEQYQQIVEKLEQYDYSDEDLKNIGKYKTRCLKIIVNNTILHVSDKIHSATKQLEGALEELGLYDYEKELKSFQDD